MNLACPECSTVYRIDPAKVPETGVSTRCRTCRTGFRIEPAMAAHSAGAVVTPDRADLQSEPAPLAESVGVGATGGTAAAATATPGAPVFGPQDPDVRAKRLARALVSDIKVYNPDKWEASRDQETLRSDFRDEILKSWEEYVEQVGETMAKRTPYFRDALNDILAQGRRLF